MTDKFHAHVKSCHRMEWLLALQRAPTPVSLLHQRRCFPEKSRPATGNRSRRRGPVPSFRPAPPGCHGHRPKNQSRSRYRQQDRPDPPGEPPATDGAGTVGEATSTPGQSRVGWGLSSTVLTVTPNCISIERNGGQGLQATAGDQLW